MRRVQPSMKPSPAVPLPRNGTLTRGKSTGSSGATHAMRILWWWASLHRAKCFASGRSTGNGRDFVWAPVLVIPHTGTGKSVGDTVLLCWNGSRESARASADALPFLKAAKKVIVLVVDQNSSKRRTDQDSAAKAGAWLARHGTKVTVERWCAPDVSVAEAILSRAADHNADLIVMGFYGHSCLRETLLGGVSRTMLESMTVPLLITH